MVTLLSENKRRYNYILSRRALSMMHHIDAQKWGVHGGAIIDKAQGHTTS